MDAQRWKQIEDGAMEALELPVEERNLFLEKYCASNKVLLAEIESFLIQHDDNDDFLKREDFEKMVGSVFEHDESRLVGKKLGSYRILHEIGAGGMGAVFLAIRDDGEFEQQVALKIVRQSIAEEQMIERFRRERQILASLNHPNIAKLLDGGISEKQEPFIAMEFVEGVPITEYVKINRLTLREILILFLKVCSALAYSHRNLVIHRDVKPGNILVTADGEPKLLDFGMAKLIDDSFDLAADQTQTALRALTPAYASPEQLRGEAITTTSDIYSLGIVLYECLTDTRPFHFAGKNLDEMIRTLTAGQPDLPSRTARHSGSQLKGDLDNVLLTALNCEQNRRYDSVERFADDLRRFLDGQPVLARAQTFGYRAAKFTRRHRFGVAAATLVLVAVIAGFGATLWQARQARQEKERAEVVNNFLQRLLNSSNPEDNLSRSNGHDTTVKELLDNASKRLQTEDLATEPAVKAELQRIIGASYLSQGQYDLAEQNLNAALELQKKTFGENSPESLRTMIALVNVWLSRGNNEIADQFYRDRLAVLRDLYSGGSIAADDLFQALYNFALLRRAQGDSREAETLIEEALRMRGQTTAGIGNDTGIAEIVLALSLADQGKFDQAENMLRIKLDSVRKELGGENSELCAALTILGGTLMEKGNYAEAEVNLAEAEPIYRNLYGPAYMPLGDNLRLQAQTLYFQGKLAEAGSKIDETLSIYRQSSNQYINYPTALVVKGLILMRNRDLPAAENVLREAVAIRLENLPRQHFLSALAISALGECLFEQKRLAEAEPLLSESYESLRNSQGELNPRTLLARGRMDKLRDLSAVGRSRR